MLDIQVDEETVKTLLQKAINKRVDEIAKEKYFFTYSELSKYLSMSRPTIEENLVKKGLPYYRVGTKYLFKRIEVDAFLDKITGSMEPTDKDLKNYERGY